MPAGALLHPGRVYQPGGRLHARRDADVVGELEGHRRLGPPDLAGPVVIAGELVVRVVHHRAVGRSHGRRRALARTGLVPGLACPADPPAGQVRHLEGAVPGGSWPGRRRRWDRTPPRTRRCTASTGPARWTRPAGELRPPSLGVGEHDDQALPLPHARNVLAVSRPGPRLVPVGHAQPVKGIILIEDGDPERVDR